jgi:hypothetical protein
MLPFVQPGRYDLRVSAPGCKKRAGATKLHRKSGEARDQVETLSRSAKALLPRINGGSHHRASAST